MVRATHRVSCTLLVLVGLWNKACAISLFIAKFQNDTGGFEYADDMFRGTSNGKYSSGKHVPGDQYTLGHLEVKLGGVDTFDVRGLSGGWARQFTLNRPGTVVVKLRYSLNITQYYETDEFAQVLCSVDGVLFGSLPNQDYIIEKRGESTNSGVMEYSWVNLNVGILTAGTHSLMIGAYNNKKTTFREVSQVRFRKVILEFTRVDDALPLPTNAPVRSVTVAPLSTPTPSTAPTTSTSSIAPTTSTQSAAPNTSTSTPTTAPTTLTPTKKPRTSMPTTKPRTPTPTKVPKTSTPTTAPVTSMPTKMPRSSTPTKAPRTSAPTTAPATSTPTKAPKTSTPTTAPATSTPTKAPKTSTPTTAPVTSIPLATSRPMTPPTKQNNTALLFTTRINAGSVDSYIDSERVQWEPDTYFQGKGEVYSQCPMDIAGTDRDPLYCNGRRFDIQSLPQPYRYVIPIPARAADYTVQLHFAELVYITSGQRIFDILINDQLVARQVDIVDAVGPNTAHVISFVTQMTNDASAITVELIPLRESPIIAAIEVLERSNDGNTVESPSPTNAPVSSPAILINCGGNNFAEAIGGRIWSPDQYFIGGSPFTDGSAIVNNTLDQDLYQTERNGEFIYEIPVPTIGSYTVILHFVEFKWTQVGQRRFNIAVEDVMTFDNVDLVSLGQGRALQAITLESNVEVDDGFLSVQLSHSIPPIDTPKLSGIEILWIQ